MKVTLEKSGNGKDRQMNRAEIPKSMSPGGQKNPKGMTECYKPDMKSWKNFRLNQWKERA